MRQIGQHAAVVIVTLLSMISFGCGGGGGTATTPTAQADPPPTKTAPTITWAAPAAITYGTALGGTQLNATANVPGNFAYSPTPGSVPAAGAQTLTVIFTPTDTTTYATAAASVSFTVNKATATLTLSALSATYDGTAKPAIAATTPAGLAVTIGYAEGGTAVAAPTNAGSYIVTATVNDPNYIGGANGTLIIAQATATISFSTGTLNQTYNGTPKTVATTTTPPGLNVNLNFTGTPTNAGSYPVTATVNDPNYTGSATGTIVIGKAAPIITWSSPAAVAYGTALSGTQLDATANIPGTFAYMPVSGAVLAAGTQNLTATFTPADATDYTSAPANVSLTVNKALPTITWAQPAAIVYGTALSTAQLDATASVPGTFVYTHHGVCVRRRHSDPCCHLHAHRHCGLHHRACNRI